MIKWIVEMGVFNDTEERLIQAIKDFGREVKTVKYIPFEDRLAEHCEDMMGEHDCVIFYGSIGFGKKIKKSRFIPGVYLNEKAFECTSYYPVFGDHLLHENYIMMPFGDLKRKKDFLFNHFDNNTLFLRPNSGTKEFTGTVTNYNQFEDSLRIASIYDVDQNLLVVVSDALKINKEYRFVIVNQKAVSGSLYRIWGQGSERLEPGATTTDLVLLNSKSLHQVCEDEKVIDFANRMASLYNPETAWTLDIAETHENELKVIEIGCFSCAGLYGNDLNKVVEAVSLAAEKEYEDYQDPIRS